jgi:hypothetical protein
VNSYARKPCAYCGVRDGTCTGGHVIPDCMYPEEMDHRIQRINVPECPACGATWQDDEAHFRAVILMCGEANELASEKWFGPVSRSFDHASGPRWVRDLFELLEPVNTPDGLRYMVYPERDERVMRVLRKIIRGLCAYHKLGAAIAGNQVLAMVKRFEIPPAFRDQFVRKSLGTDFCWYSYSDQRGQDGGEFHSAWEIEFYGRTRFFCIVSASAENWTAQVA